MIKSAADWTDQPQSSADSASAEAAAFASSGLDSGLAASDESTAHAVPVDVPSSSPQTVHEAAKVDMEPSEDGLPDDAFLGRPIMCEAGEGEGAPEGLSAPRGAPLFAVGTSTLQHCSDKCTHSVLGLARPVLAGTLAPSVCPNCVARCCMKQHRQTSLALALDTAACSSCANSISALTFAPCHVKYNVLLYFFLGIWEQAAARCCRGSISNAARVCMLNAAYNQQQLSMWVYPLSSHNALSHSLPAFCCR